MRKSRFNEPQIMAVFRQAESRRVCTCTFAGITGSAPETPAACSFSMPISGLQ